jgi:hypothetical protein
MARSFISAAKSKGSRMEAQDKLCTAKHVLSRIEGSKGAAKKKPGMPGFFTYVCSAACRNQANICSAHIITANFFVALLVRDK